MKVATAFETAFFEAAFTEVALFEVSLFGAAFSRLHPSAFSRLPLWTRPGSGARSSSPRPDPGPSPMPRSGTTRPDPGPHPRPGSETGSRLTAYSVYHCYAVSLGERTVAWLPHEFLEVLDPLPFPMAYYC